MPTPRIYLDHAATTPLLPEAHAAMEPWLATNHGNPSSLHQEGRKAKAAIDEARETISQALGCLFAEIIFTASGTEAATLAIVGAALANENPTRNRILLGAAEHHCVLHTEPILRRLGYQFELIPVDPIARVRLDSLEDQLKEDILLISVMHANNEFGTLQPIQEIAKLAQTHGALFHCDAVQTFLSPLPQPTTAPTRPPQRGASLEPRVERALRQERSETLGQTADQPTLKGWQQSPSWTVHDLVADLISLSAHKINGPKGAGALYVKAGTKLKPITPGGGQERELRGGTENVAAIVGFGQAVKTLPPLPDNRPQAAQAFLQALKIPTAIQTVPNPSDRLPGHVHLRIPGVQAETMLILLDRMGIAASSGAACSSGSIEPSHVLLACGYTAEEAKEGLRFTFGRDTTADEACEAAKRVSEAASRLLKS